MSAGHIETLGLRVLEGRTFEVSDRQDTPLVALVNETMARRFWNGESAVGHTFTIAHTTRTYRIAGVVSNHKIHGVLERPIPYVYFASAQRAAALQRPHCPHLATPTSCSCGCVRRDLLAMEPGLVFVGNGTDGQQPDDEPPAGASRGVAGHRLRCVGHLLAAIGPTA